MSGLLIVTIITLAVISCVFIFIMLFAYRVILNGAKKMASTGALDQEFLKEDEDNKKPKKRVLDILTQVISGIVAAGLITLALISGIYRASGEQFVSNNHVSFVIATNSMDGYANKDYKASLIQAYSDEYSVDLKVAEKKLRKDQFEVGDWLTFNVVKADEELHYYDVYGYKTEKGLIITHRLIGTNSDGTLVFRGDNAGGEDVKVNREQVLYRYQGQHTKYIGLVVLFFGSGYGIYCIAVTIGVFVVSEIAIYKWEKIKKQRLKEIKMQKKE